MNLLTGEYNRPNKINQWFSDFLESFTGPEYYAQTTRIKPWQFKNLMEMAERNSWNMLSAKQWFIFEKYIKFESSAFEMFANFEHNGITFNIRVSRDTGFATIKISG